MQSWRVSNHLAVLAADLRQRMRYDPLPPEEDEAVLVQSRQLAEWLERRLADELGACAGIRWMLPGDLLNWCDDAPRGADPWTRERLRWRLHQAVEATAVDHPLLSAAWNPADPLACHRLLEQLADAYDTWQLQRPELLAAWAEGSAEGPEPHAAWQAALWRTLLAGTPVAPRNQRLAVAIAAVRRGDARLLSRAPRRLTAFAISNLPLPLLDLLEGFGQHRQLTVALWSPSPLPWADLPSQREAARRLAQRVSSVAAFVQVEPTALPGGMPDLGDAGEVEAGHPLLAALAGQSRRWFRALGRDSIANAWDPLPFVTPDCTSDLHQIQSDMQELCDPRTRPERPTIRVDGSLAIHRCSSERRELEVLRDQIVAACAADPELTPDQVLVLLPDVATYAALVPAVFGRVLADGQRIPWRIVDRSMADSDPLASGLLALTTLIGSRMMRSQVLAVLDLPALRLALGFGQEDLDQVTGWLDLAGVHWGADRQQRAACSGSAMDQAPAAGTWDFTLDRLCAGAWYGRVEQAHDVLPIAGDLPGDLALLARFTEWFATLREVLEVGSSVPPPTLAGWAQWSEDALRLLLLPADHATDDADALRALIADLLTDAAGTSGTQEPLSPAVWRALLEQRCSSGVSARPLGSPGGVTFAGLKPLRAIPATFVAILGLDDRAFPRTLISPTWDVVGATAARSGDRDPRQEDRQLFLEAMSASGERLHLSWVASCPRTGRDRAPSICLREVLETIDLTFAEVAGKPASHALITTHPLQPFSPLVTVTADPLAVRQAQALATARPAASPLVDASSLSVAALSAQTPAPTPAQAPDADLTLDELIRTLADPAKTYLRHHLGIDVFEEPPPPSDDEVLQLDYREQWHLRHELIQAQLAGCTDSTDRLVADGAVAPGALGEVTVAALAHEAAEQVARIRAAGGCDNDSIAVSLIAPDGHTWRLSATVPAPGVHGVVLWTASGLAAKAHLHLWLTAVVWQAWCQKNNVAHQHQVAIVARKKPKREDSALVAYRLADPLATLDRLVRLALRARHELLPLPVQASCKAADELAADPNKPQPSFAVRKLCFGLSSSGDDEQDEHTIPDLSGWTAAAWRGHQPLNDPRWLPLVDELWRGYPFRTAP